VSSLISQEAVSSEPWVASNETFSYAVEALYELLFNNSAGEESREAGCRLDAELDLKRQP
jgi:hypothetical protein